jgi:hypothetical protein
MPRTARQSTIQLLGALLALGVITLLVWTTTSAAFLDTTDNTNTFATGNVTLDDNDIGAAQFSVTNMAPGYNDESCIEVIYNGSIDAPDITPVRFYGSSTDAPLTGTVSDDLTVVVQRGSGAVGFGDCTGFVSAETLYSGPVSGLPVDFATGLGTWQPNTAGDSASYRFVVDFPSNPQDTSEGATATVNFIWEIQTS